MAGNPTIFETQSGEWLTVSIPSPPTEVRQAPVDHVRQTNLSDELVAATFLLSHNKKGGNGHSNVSVCPLTRQR